MARRHSKSRARDPEDAAHVFFHPRRGAIVATELDPSSSTRWGHGGRDDEWRTVAWVRVTRSPLGTILPVPGQPLPRGYLWGDPEAQICGLGGPVLVFGPLARTCRDCGEAFVFTAREQKHLAETLRLYLDVTKVRCRACAKAKLVLTERRKAYAEALLAAEESPSAATHLAAARAAVALVESGGSAPLAKALAHCRRARRLGARAAADRTEAAITRLILSPIGRRP